MVLLLQAQRPVSGIVADRWSGAPLQGATVWMKGSQISTSTDDSGRFTLLFPNAGPLRVTVEKAGYRRWSGNVHTNRENHITLRPQGRRSPPATDSLRHRAPSPDIPLDVETASHPARLLRGRVPGLQVASPGGDPNGSWELRLDGLQTLYGFSQPFVWVDGMPDVPLWSLDPLEVQNFNVQNDLDASRELGIRGSAGGIAFSTIPDDTTVSIGFHSGLTTETWARRWNTLSREEFLARDLPNFGSETDWTDLITRTALSHFHHLSIHASDSLLHYHASATWRNKQGILRGSGFDHRSARLGMGSAFFEKKMHLGIQLAAAERREDLSFPEAFRYAVTFNPTAPVHSASEMTGGYFWEPRFDYFNPVALIEQNLDENKRTLLSGALRLEIQWTPWLRFRNFSSLLHHISRHGEYYARTDPYRGLWRQGLASYAEEHHASAFTRSQIEAVFEKGPWKMETSLGWDWQRRVNESISTEAGGFISDALKYHNLQFANDYSLGRGQIASDKRADRRTAQWLSATLQRGLYRIAAVLRREGSSRLAPGHRYVWLPAFSFDIDLSECSWWPRRWLATLSLRRSSTANLPPPEARHYRYFEESGYIYYNGRFMPAYQLANEENPAMAAERSNRWSLHASLGDRQSGLRLDATWFRTRSFDLFFEEALPSPPHLWYKIWWNASKIHTSGWHLSLQYASNPSSRIGIETTVHLFTAKTVVDDLARDPQVTTRFYSYPGAPGICCGALTRLKEGEPVGQLWGLPFFDITPSGEWIVGEFEQVIGRGLPRLTAGWQQKISLGNWSLRLGFDAAFGHQLFNLMRLFYEKGNLGPVNEYNGIKTRYYIPHSQAYAPLSSYFVEKASYLRLSSAVFSWQTRLGKGSPMRLRIYLAANDLFTLTRYTGPDPEVRLSDPGTADNGSRLSGKPNILAPGIDRRNRYLPARGFTFGAEVAF